MHAEEERRLRKLEVNRVALEEYKAKQRQRLEEQRAIELAELEMKKAKFSTGDHKKIVEAAAQKAKARREAAEVSGTAFAASLTLGRPWAARRRIVL